jgi:hypothetical protein
MIHCPKSGRSSVGKYRVTVGAVYPSNIFVRDSV